MIFWWLKDFELMKAAGLNVLRLGAGLPIYQLPDLEFAHLHRRSWNIVQLRRRCHVAWCGTTTRCLQWKLSSYRAGHCSGGSHLWDLHFGWYAPGPLTDAAAKLSAKMTEVKCNIMSKSTVNTCQYSMENPAALEWALVGHGWKDLLSEKFCGEGVPLWAAQPVPVPFPVPLSLPFLPGACRQLQSTGSSSIIAQRDVLSTVWCRQHFSGWDGLPKREDCARFESWAEYQAAIATGPDVWPWISDHETLETLRPIVLWFW